MWDPDMNSFNHYSYGSIVEWLFRRMAGIEIKELTLYGIYSGEDRIITYPNGDICCGTGITFKTTAYRGEIQNNTEEALEHRFFDKTTLPDNINKYDKQIIIDWTKNLQQVIVD